MSLSITIECWLRSKVDFGQMMRKKFVSNILEEFYVEYTSIKICKDTAKDTPMLPSQIDQIKVSHETGSEANFGFRRVLMPSCLGMCPPFQFSDTASECDLRMWPSFTGIRRMHEVYPLLLQITHNCLRRRKQPSLIWKIDTSADVVFTTLLKSPPVKCQ